VNWLGMANSPPVVFESSTGTKCDRDMTVKSNRCSAKPFRASVLLLLVLPLLYITAVASLEVSVGDAYQLLAVGLH
jgi:hypothetical protein